MSLFNTMRASALCAAIAATVLAAAVPARAAEILEFDVEGQTLRLGPIAGLCVLDRDDPANATAWSMIGVQMPRTNVIAAVGHCDEFDRSGLSGLTTIYTAPGETGLSEERVGALSAVALELVPVTFDDPTSFIVQTFRLFEQAGSPNAKLAGLHLDDVLIEGTDLSSQGLRGILVTGLTPMRGMIVQTLTIDIAQSEEALAFLALINHRVLTSIREHTPSVALRRR